MEKQNKINKYRSRKEIINIDSNLIIKLYRELDSITKIASIFNVSPTTIWNILKENNIKMQKGMLGRNHNNNTKIKISNSRKGKCLGKDNFFYGKKHTKESLNKMCIFQKYRKRSPLSEEHKKNISKSHIGIINSEETRKKMSKSLKGRISPMKGKKLEELYGIERAKEIREKSIKSHLGRKASEKSKQKLRDYWKKRTHPSKNKRFPIELYPNMGFRKTRKDMIFPIKDTSIEVKIQNYLKQLGIEFLTHQYMKDIEHGYQCDIMIPVQEGINKKTIIECFGTYWHKYPKGREIDTIRCNELRKAGWRVLVFWENEIHIMKLNDLNNKLMEVKNGSRYN